KGKMAVPLLTKKIVKKRVKQFKRPQSDRKVSVKYCETAIDYPIPFRLNNYRFY
ncbi:hypothetical protein OIU85_022611, partial [Salix viminalis]